MKRLTEEELKRFGKRHPHTAEYIHRKRKEKAEREKSLKDAENSKKSEE